MSKNWLIDGQTNTESIPFIEIFVLSTDVYAVFSVVYTIHTAFAILARIPNKIISCYLMDLMNKG